MKNTGGICADPKATARLTVLQSVYIIFCSFLCEWDSRARDCTEKNNGHSIQKQDQVRRIISCCEGKVKNLLASIAHHARYDKNVCKSDG
jgi:hypothetical protein